MIERANATPYGLAAYVFGQDIDRCRAVASRLEVGIVGSTSGVAQTRDPFRWRQTKRHRAEGGEEGLREFLATESSRPRSPVFMKQM